MSIRKRMFPSVYAGCAWMLLAAFVLLLCTDSALAAQQQQPSNCSQYVGLTNHIAGCILNSVDHAAHQFYAQFFPYVSRAVLAVTLLGVILYGVMIAAGMIENVGRDTIIFFIKVAAVSFFVQNSDYMYTTVYGIMNDTATEVVSMVPTNSSADGTVNFDQLTCLGNMTSASVQSGKAPTGPWLAIDCLIDTVIGIKVPNANGQTNSDASATNKKISLQRSGVSRGLIYFFSSCLTSSTVGMIIGAIGFLFLWSLIALTIKTLLAYISGFLGVTFLIIISPLFIPLVLLPGEVPKQYFGKWLELVIGLALQPILMLIFIILFISAVDLAMFSGDYSIMYRIAGDATRKQGFDINQYIADHNGVDPAKPIKLFETKTGALSPELSENKAMSLVNGLFESKCGQEALGVTLSADDKKACAQTAPVQAYRRSLDWEKLASARSPAVQMEDGAATNGQQLSREVLSSSIFCAVILLVLNRVASVVPAMINDLVGGYGQTPNLYANATAIRPASKAAGQPKITKR